MNWDTLSQSSLEEILNWAGNQPWCQAMAQCAQDADWHAEGDVWTHTQMVCRQLTELNEWSNLAPQEQIVLIFTALLHDAAKPLTSQTDPKTGRIRSPKHAVKGEHLTRSILRELDCNLETRETICRLVRFHGRPAFLLEKSKPEHEVVSLSWLVNHRLLYLFALADTRGRTTDSMSRPEEHLRFWKMIAEELNCFDQPYPFSNDQARFLFYRCAEPNLHYVPHEDYTCTVTILSGLPGSGKDTWLAKHRPDLPVVSLDEVRAELEIHPTENQGEVAQVAQERCRQFLRAKTSFAYNATNLSRQTRQRWINLFSDYGARIEIVYLEPPLKTIVQQNQQRTKSVPEKVIHQLAQRCEPPTITEAHSLTLTEY
ncbi:AAA family ATPase [uncultured Gimesia sp.]|uniref:AAA family ATPase n=1 Tax=uncultured Gimesia sp. TaxID=1678688 RepID=UPI0030DBDBDA|tara:strand:+ start:90586 stop:91698 length:1113 start_codon:yes stop_codon:yes gene_type:complete